MRTWFTYNRITILIYILLAVFVCKLVLPTVNEIFNGKLTSVITILDTYTSVEKITLGIAGLTLIVTLWQFNAKTHQDSLTTYNQRFDNEPTIRKVTSVLTKCEYLELEIEKPQISSLLKTLHPAEIELYYRFFEEMELGIQRGILKGRDVKRLFAYYAIQGLDKYNLIPQDEIESCWPLLNSFKKRMKKLKPAFNAR